MQKTAAPLKKGMHLYKLEKGKILINVVTGVGPKFVKLQPGRTPDPKNKWKESTILAQEDRPGVWAEAVDRGIRDEFYADIDVLRQKLFLASLKVLETGNRYSSVLIDVSKLEIETIKMIAKDLGVSLDLGILSQQPVDS